MPLYLEKPPYETLEQALLESYKADTLKALAKLVCHKIPTRKADIVSALCGTMLSGNLKSRFESLDDMGRAAVREAVFSPEGILDLVRFEAKYQQATPLGKAWPGAQRVIWWIFLSSTGVCLRIL